ncbi:MAG: O-methyltransferase [Deltaproteobacteria bacterium]
MKQSSETDSYIVNPEIEDYLSSLTPVEDAILKEMELYAGNNDFPIVGPLVGRFLSQIALMTGAKKVLELGSGFGYSAYWFAGSVGEGGSVVFTELSPGNSRLAEDYLTRAGVRDRVRIITGNALDVLDSAQDEFDIIFNDIDKEYYPEVVDKAYAKLRKGGLLITDNVLWFGRVVSGDNSPSTEGVREFTRLLLSREGFFTTIIPIRDGVSLSLKL